MTNPRVFWSIRHATLALVTLIGTAACDGGNARLTDAATDGVGDGSPGSGGTSGSGGGSVGGTGGSPGSGGASGSGGAPGTGGSSPGSGGAPGSGGSPGAGGAIGSGGASGSGGGQVGSGGSPGSGGASGSGGAPGSGGSPGSGGRTASTSQYLALPPLDLLFVIDNSPSMESSQTNLSGGFSAMMNALRTMSNAPVPSLHVGVITTDMGSGAVAVGVPGCSKQPLGDRGQLQNTPGYSFTWDATANRYKGTAMTCSGPSDRFLSTAENETLRNFSGTIEEAFGCIAPVGIQGCGYESPIGSTMAALGGLGTAPPENAGFVRQDANLAIVMVTDEDDCSPALDSMLCDPTSFDLSGALGPLTSYRCSAFNQICDGKPLPLRPQDASSWPVTLTNCQSSESPYSIKVQDAIAFLRGLKSRAEALHLSVIAAPVAPYVVGLDSTLPTAFGLSEEWPVILPTCTVPAVVGPGGQATSAIRLAQLTAAFAPHSSFHSLCDPFVETMAALGGKLAARAVLHCLDSLQSASNHCTVTLQRLGTGSQAPFAIPQCDSASGAGGPAPCWYRQTTTLCSAGTRLVLNDSQPLSASTRIAVTCD